MKNKAFIMIFSLALCLVLSINVFAETPRLVDNADVLTSDEESELLIRLDEVSEKHKVDVSILTIGFIGNMDFESIAIEHFEQSQYGFSDGNDGVLLLFAINEKDEDDMYCHVIASGIGKDAISDYDIDSIIDNMRGLLKSKQFSDAFNVYIEECDELIKDELSFDFFFWIIIAVVIAAIIAFVVVSVFKGQLKSVKMQSGAMNYVKSDSMKVTNSNDLFLYRNVTRVAKPQNNNTRSSSSSGGGYRSRGGKI